MTFEQSYKKLEEEFRRRAKEDEQTGIDSIFLPNILPSGPVDYVLVGMEPSLRGWARDKEDAEKKIEKGFRNFTGVWILHCPVKEYLCRNGETYYITDLAKGAMLTSSPSAGDMQKYERWYPLLEKELGLVAKPDAKIISIGHAVGRFLFEKGLYGHAGTIPHYSAQAARYWGTEIPGRDDEYRDFEARVVNRADGKPLSDAQKKLWFDYKVRFERIRDQGTSGWRRWQQEWQRQLSTE